MIKEENIYQILQEAVDGLSFGFPKTPSGDDRVFVAAPFAHGFFENTGHIMTPELADMFDYNAKYFSILPFRN